MILEKGRYIKCTYLCRYVVCPMSLLRFCWKPVSRAILYIIQHYKHKTQQGINHENWLNWSVYNWTSKWSQSKVPLKVWHVTACYWIVNKPKNYIFPWSCFEKYLSKIYNLPPIVSGDNEGWLVKQFYIRQIYSLYRLLYLLRYF